jgi:hypothetical protein
MKAASRQQTSLLNHPFPTRLSPSSTNVCSEPQLPQDVPFYNFPSEYPHPLPQLSAAVRVALADFPGHKVRTAVVPKIHRSRHIKTLSKTLRVTLRIPPIRQSIANLGLVDESLEEGELETEDPQAILIHLFSLNAADVLVQATAGLDDELVSRILIVVSREFVGTVGAVIDEQMCIAGRNPRGHELLRPADLQVYWEVF